ncbi:MAG TPA: hypothetical protein VGF47_10085, partial [Solirubrobacteraceae bacterium]
EIAEEGESGSAVAMASVASPVASNAALGGVLPSERDRPIDGRPDALRALHELAERVGRLERELGELRATVGAGGSVDVR